MEIPLQAWYALNVSLNVYNALNFLITALNVKLGELIDHFYLLIIFHVKTPAHSGCMETIQTTHVNIANPFVFLVNMLLIIAMNVIKH